MSPLPDTFLPAAGGNFDYQAFASAVAAALAPVQRVRVEPWHTLQTSELEVGGTQAQALYPIAGQLGLILRADAANSGSVYVGSQSAVNATDYALAKGDTLTLGTDACVWVIGSTSGQLLHVIAGG